MDEPDELERLLGIHSRSRLVEQEKPGLSGDGPAALEPPLVTVGQVACVVLAVSAQPTVREEFPCVLVSLPFFALEPWSVEDACEHAAPESGVHTDEHVFD